MRHRVERVSELMKRELGDLIGRELTFEQLVTVQAVDLTPDLKHAHVYVSVLGNGEGSSAVMAKLHEHRKELQAQLARRVILKYTPQLHFKLDETVERGSRVIEILQTLDLPPESPSEEKPPNQHDEG